jgi:phage/plasmid-associated DNA primase
MFLAEHLEYQGGTATDIPAGDLYNEYQKWCESQGLNKPLTAIKFAVEVDRAFPGVQKASPVTREGKSVRVRFGLKWKEEVSPTAA